MQLSASDFSLKVLTVNSLFSNRINDTLKVNKLYENRNYLYVPIRWKKGKVCYYN